MTLRRALTNEPWAKTPKALIGLFLAALLNTGCQLETTLGASGQMWMWLAIPLLGFGLVGAVVVWWRRHNQIQRWRVDQGEPPVRGIVIGMVVVAFVLAVIFILQNVFVEIDPRQRMFNIGLWLLGTIAGSTAALLIGLKTAEPK